MKRLICRLLYHLYDFDRRFVRRGILHAVTGLEGGEMYSDTLRRIFAGYHDIHIGPYSYGGCFNAEGIGRGTRANVVITEDVPAFAIVGGNPARVIRYRFSPEKIEEIMTSRWWKRSIDELDVDFDDFTRPVEQP